jgi:hypothetical protein
MTLRSGFIAAVTLAACGGIASAHHSLAGQFDVKQTVILEGVVSRVDWINPHIYLHLDVKDGSGKAATWRLEAVPVAMMRKAGLTKAELKGNGEKVTVVAFPARDGTPNLGFMMKITYPDGHFYQFNPDPREKAG